MTTLHDREITRQKEIKRYISTSSKAMTAKLGKLEIYNKESPFIWSFDGLSTLLIDQVTDKKCFYSTSARTVAKKYDSGGF